MRTHFRAEHLADAGIAAAEKNLRACVHCGMCTATCPTYVLLGDERDGPRGRIVMMQKMLEEHAAPSAETVTHLDRCLSCLGCRTACPSGVEYARLIDRSRAHIEQHYHRPIGERLLRWTIANVLTRPALTRIALRLARLASPLRALLPLRFRNVVDAAEAMPIGRLHLCAAAGERRIALLPGCVQQVIAPEIDEAMARLLARRGISLVPLEGAGCCGALAHHLGREAEARMWAKRLIEAFERAMSVEGILITATGCASHINEYEYLFLDDPEWRSRARAVSEKLLPLEALLGPPRSPSESKLRVALQVPCSQQHGLRWPDAGELLQASGFEVLQIPDGHLCCGSAGSYSILQPEIASALRTGKLANILAVKPDVVATTNIGCLQHLSGPDAPPIVHVAELLDWAEGGPPPRALDSRAQLMTAAQRGR
ncbi:MAG: glycolate oxidase subunit GlcF [Alphaproteobacteria bacterium]|jgi:glycolate oxidase iron-sulfur subunit